MRRRWAFLIFILASILGYILGAFMHSEFWHFFSNLFPP